MKALSEASSSPPLWIRQARSGLPVCRKATLCLRSTVWMSRTMPTCAERSARLVTHHVDVSDLSGYLLGS